MKKFSGQSDEPTDEDYNGNYDDEFTSESVEVSPSNLSSLTTIGDGKNEQTADEKVNETTPIPSTESSFTVPAAATTTMETHKPIETTAGIICSIFNAALQMANFKIIFFYLFLFLLCEFNQRYRVESTKLSTKMPLHSRSGGLFASKFATNTKQPPSEYGITQFEP